MSEKSCTLSSPLSPPECTPPSRAKFDANRPMALRQGQTHPNGCVLPPTTPSRHSHSPFTRPPQATPPLSAQPESTIVGDFHGFLNVRFCPHPILESYNGPQICVLRGKIPLGPNPRTCPRPLSKFRSLGMPLITSRLSLKFTTLLCLHPPFAPEPRIPSRLHPMRK